MKRIRIKISKTEPGVRCAMVSCVGWASHRIAYIDADGNISKTSQDFCDAHFTAFMLNDLIEVVE